ncbi:heme exporter protein CcmB [Metallumcola ferriviriculae]|uniref:Heme exporter protein B n=1 Tax=Metallumcola ferriviriculae TaxID=3039180 RepID=A0AAU0UKI3_9FIRM|nr:heme exporter protein CcmB [Desulfitibacteraceae bacterium MK1]
MGFFAKVGNIVWKDLVTEFRTKEMLSAMLIFSVLVIVIFAFAFTPTRDLTSKVFPGIIWVAFTFSGILGLNRSFLNEKQNETLLGLMLAPVDRTAIYFGKVISNLAMMLIMEIISLPLFFVLFDYRFSGSLLQLLLVIFLGTLGFIAVGTFLAALAANTRTSEILLPIILFPILVPVIIAAVESTGLILAGHAFADFSGWVKLIGVYDVVFLVVPFILFDYVLEV